MKEAGARVRFPPPLVFALGAGAGVLMKRLVVHAHFSFDWPVRVVVGAAIGAAGVASLASARVWFVRTKQDPLPWTPTPELIQSGPYRFTRNPMYVGMTLLGIGLGIAVDNPFIAGFAPVALGIVHLVAVRPEERYLTQRFGSAYVEYTQRVRRYL